MVPAARGTSPRIARSSVLLPAPLGPMSATDSPGAIDAVTPTSASVAPKRTVAPSSTSAAVGGGGGGSAEVGGGSAEVGNEDLRVVADHLDVGGGAGAVGAEGVTVQSVLAGHHRHVRLRADGLG